MKMTPHAACLKVLCETEKVLKLILNGDPQTGKEQELPIPVTQKNQPYEESAVSSL
jgi:hypothetical protein